MISMWLFGDLYRVSYYEQKQSPAQLIICAFFSCLVDCAILSQFWIYRKLTAYEDARLKSSLSVDTESFIMTTTISADFTISNTADQS